jgi:hypothetical protein
MPSEIVDLVKIQSALGSKLTLLESEGIKTTNTFFSPRLQLNIYKCKVKNVINQHTINISLDKAVHFCVVKALDALHENVSNRLAFEKLYKPYFDQKDNVLLRLYIPKKDSRYVVKCTENNGLSTCSFTLPRAGCVFDHIVVEIKNIWSQGNKSGYNVELKEVHYSV